MSDAAAANVSEDGNAIRGVVIGLMIAIPFWTAFGVVATLLAEGLA